MSQTAITLAFEQWKAQQAATGEPVLLDEFVFALVPGLDPDLPVDRSETLPPATQIVYREPVTRKGVVNENAVVHSAVLGADVGDFSFNWIGLTNKASGTLAMIVHAPEQQKLKTKEGQQGNVLTRSFLMEYNGAQTETAINTPAETWQIDFTARMAGMDERQRLENIDIYGAAAFFGDGWLVGKTGNQFYVTAGSGYVRGLRAQLAANQNITVTTKPVKVWLDVAWTGTLTSAWSVTSKITVAANLTDYAQNGVQHYVYAVASIDANGNITDLRPKGTLNDQSASDALKKHEQSRNHPDATTAAKGFTQLSSATDSTSETLAATPKAVKAVNDDLTGFKKSLGTAAKADVTTSTSDPTPGRITKVGDGGLLGQALSVTDANLADKNGLVSMMFNQGGGANSIHFGGYGCGVHINYGSSGDGSQAMSANLFVDSSGNLSVEWLAIKKADGTIASQRIQKLWGPLNKPTPNDIGALPASPNALAVDLNTLGDRINHGVYYQPSNAGATAAYHYPVTIAGTLFVTQSAYGCQQMYITYTGRLFLRAVQGAWTGSGPWSPWVEMYGPNNRPTPDNVNCIARDGSHIGGFVSGNAAQPYLRHTASNAVVVLAKAGDSYTKAESDGRYPLKTATVIDVRQGSPGTIVLKRNGWNYVPGGCAFTGWYVEGDAPVDDTIQYKPIQININGAWRTISG